MLTAEKAPHAISTQYLRSLEAVADTSHRFDDVLAELGAEPPYAHVDDVAPGIEREPPYVSKQLLTGAHLSPLSHQVLQEKELSLGQGHLTLAGIDDATYQIEGQRSRSELALAGACRGLAEAGAHAGDQLSEGEGLRDVVGRTELEAADLAIDVRQG